MGGAWAPRRQFRGAGQLGEESWRWKAWDILFGFVWSFSSPNPPEPSVNENHSAVGNLHGLFSKDSGASGWVEPVAFPSRRATQQAPGAAVQEPAGGEPFARPRAEALWMFLSRPHQLFISCLKCSQIGAN